MWNPLSLSSTVLPCRSIRLRPTTRKAWRGFTLIEMVVVVLILGIVAAVAVPRMFGTADKAGENATHQQLALLRTAIELYRSETGNYPAGGNSEEFIRALEPYLRGPFPSPQMGEVRDLQAVYFDIDGTVTTAAAPQKDGVHGWVYKAANGDIRLNVKEGETGFDW